MRTGIVIAGVLAMLAGWSGRGTAGEGTAPLTEAVLAERGAEHLTAAVLRSLIIGKTLTVRNLATEKFFEARYGTDGKRRVSRIAEGPAPGTATAETAPYVIHDGKITTSYRGRVFEVRIYPVDGRLLAARTADDGNVNWEIVEVKE